MKDSFKIFFKASSQMNNLRLCAYQPFNALIAPTVHAPPTDRIPLSVACFGWKKALKKVMSHGVHGVPTALIRVESSGTLGEIKKI